MKRTFPYLAIGLLAIIVVVEWHSIRANDEKNDPVIEDRAEISEVIRIVERIEELEKRLSVFESTESQVRQADSRATEEPSRPEPIVGPTLKPPTTFVPSPKFFEDNADDQSDEEVQQTNGRRWKFQLLGHRRKSASDRTL